MNFFRPVLCACALLVVGCKARAPALELSCVKHQDCALIAQDAACCEVCQPRVGNVASIDALRAWCAARKTAEPCPELKCAPPSASTALCDDGRCIARPGVHQL